MGKRTTENFSPRTDLAIEVREMIPEKGEIDGVRMSVDEEEGVNVTTVEILNEQGEKQMGKPVGTYITVESQFLKDNDITKHEDIINRVSKEIKGLCKIPDDGVVLVVGLGNWNVTPDALGPKVISKILVTRHLLDSLPEEIDGSVRPVAAVSPGVMGITGIETGEIIKGIAEKLKPSLIIAIDSLAARRTARLNSVIQMSDTGLSPGSGIGNKRMSMDEGSMGVPVIAVGVPTVVDAATLVNDTMDKMLSEMAGSVEEGGEFYNMLKNLEGSEKYKLITDILDPYTGNMFVTPKEVDAVIDRLANIISNAINIALHHGITMEDINRFNY